MHLIEPFLIVLNRRGVVASPRDLPLSHMTDALFDWVGIEQVHRPTKTGIRAIARYIAGWIEERGAEYGREIRRHAAPDKLAAAFPVQGRDVEATSHRRPIRAP